MTEQRLTSVEGGVMTITMNRPDKKNALTKAMYSAINRALELAMTDGKVRVVVLRGTGGVFTSGNDLMDFASGDLGDEGGEPPVFKLLRLLASFTKPLVAAVEGPAIGIGTTALLHCDYVLVHKDAKLAMPFVNLGLCPEAGSSYLLPKIMGHVRAAELLLFGDPFTAAKAYEYGLVNRVVDGDVYAEAQKVAEHLAAKAPGALRVTKEFMKKGEAALLQKVIEDEGMTFAGRLATPEAQEAFAAFMQRRKPDFSAFE